MIYTSFKSFIPFQTPPSIKKYLDDYNKIFLSRIINYYSEKRNYQKFLQPNFELNNLHYPKENIVGNQIQLYNNPPFTPNIEISILLFSISSLFMYLLSKKYN